MEQTELYISAGKSAAKKEAPPMVERVVRQSCVFPKEQRFTLFLHKKAQCSSVHLQQKHSPTEVSPGLGPSYCLAIKLAKAPLIAQSNTRNIKEMLAPPLYIPSLSWLHSGCSFLVSAFLGAVTQF